MITKNFIKNNVFKYRIEDNITIPIEHIYEKRWEYDKNKKSIRNGMQSEGFEIVSQKVEPVVNKIKQIVNENHLQSLHDVGFFYWFNINPKGGFNNIHTHNIPDMWLSQISILSGVYYISVPVDSKSNINFYTDAEEKIPFNVNNGDLLIFDPDLPHNVDTNQSDDDRISMAFNFFVDNQSKKNTTLI